MCLIFTDLDCTIDRILCLPSFYIFSYVTLCSRLKAYRNDYIPRHWKLKQIMQFSTYPIIYILMSHDQEYKEQPIYKQDIPYSEDSESDTTIVKKPISKLPLTNSEAYF